MTFPLTFWRIRVFWLFGTRLVFERRWFDVVAVLERRFIDVRIIHIGHSWEQLGVVLGIGRFTLFSHTCPIRRSKMTFEKRLFLLRLGHVLVVSRLSKITLFSTTLRLVLAFNSFRISSHSRPHLLLLLFIWASKLIDLIFSLVGRRDSH